MNLSACWCRVDTAACVYTGAMVQLSRVHEPTQVHTQYGSGDNGDGGGGEGGERVANSLSMNDRSFEAWKSVAV